MIDNLPIWVQCAVETEIVQNLPKGPYTVWERYGFDGWHFTDYPTLEAALEHHSYSATRVIQKPVQFKVTETQ